MIRFESVSKVYDGIAVVDDVSLTLERGTITAVVGTSGSGKSTLLRMVNRLVEPTAGRVLLDGTDTASVPAADLRRRIGYVIQDHGLFPHWTAARNIATVPGLLGWPRAAIDARVRELMLMLQLDPDVIGPRFPHELSGGQAQRVGVARALAARPEVLLMDEPFGALDPVIRQQAQTDLRKLQQQLGTTVMLVTHDMAEAIRLGDRIAVMRAGRIDQFAPPAEIIAAPATGFVADLLGEGDRAFRYLSLQPAARLARPGAADGPVLPADATMADALAEMIWSGRDRLPVAGPDGHPAGVCTRDDLIRAGRPG
ncbi:ABC transporter ATP-binding protein [uncultured Paracoccus sp.]|uniref:ABC transporter ATP-binding protein n=1 Tax=uncultured Paracoccus sp. TaxID=189685 RepID=UPI00263661C9|nr:ABC transporter ATP-binding protein [uncultured Paracoccus sp.]